MHPRQFSHFNHPCQFTASVAVCHLNNNHAALLQPEARLIASVVATVNVKSIFIFFIFYESVIRNGSPELLEEGATEQVCTKARSSVKGTECFTAGIHQSNPEIGDQM